jgi:GxxExxY protein
MSQLREPSPEMDVLAKAVIDAAIEVHRALGPGFLESIYEEALAVELTTRQIPFERQKPLTVLYKDRPNFNVPVLRSGIQRVILS